MTNIGMLTPDRFHLERSNRGISSKNFTEMYLGHSLFDFPRRLFLNPFDIDDEKDDNHPRFAPCAGDEEDETKSSTKKKPKAWSVRARRDEPNLLRGDR